MKACSCALTLILLCALGSPSTLAENWFVELHAGMAWPEGDSDTTDGGAAFAGGGIVEDVELDRGGIYGAAFARRIAERWAVALEYDRVTADVAYAARYPTLGDVVDPFRGEAASDALIVSGRYTLPLGDASRWSLGFGLGVGVAFNSLEDVEEEFVPSDGIPDAFLEDGDETDFAARAAARSSYRIADRWSVFGEATALRLGQFSTGDARTLPGGASEPIEAYELEVWTATFTLGAGYRF